MSAQVGAIEQVVQAVKSGELSQEAIEASVKRVKDLKTKYLLSQTSSTLANSEERITRQSTLASEVYTKSTTVVRSEPGTFPISAKQSKIVFVSPGKAPLEGDAVDSGKEKTREPHTPSTYIDLLRVHNSNIIDIRFHDGIPLSAESEKAIEGAETVIFATRNASLSQYQKDFGLSLGKKLGFKLIVVATCDPYDFLKETEKIKNYVTIYEPTLPAFKSAVDVIFGIRKAQGSLPVGLSVAKHDIRLLTSSDEDCKTLWALYQEVFSKWPISLQRLTKILRNGAGKHYIHDKGFCMSFLLDGRHGKISTIGVLPGYRGKGLGTALVTRAQEELRVDAFTVGMGELKDFGIGSVFPRFWPGVPIDFPEVDKDFFLHRGKHSSMANFYSYLS